MVVQVFVAERQAEHPLANHGSDRMRDQVPIAAVAEAGREALNEPDRPVGRGQQQRTGIRRHKSAVEGSDHTAASRPSEIHLVCVTVCGHRGATSQGL